MKKRTTEEWLELFRLQAASGLSQAQFCKARHLCPKYFSLRKRQLSEAASSGFIRLQRDVREVSQAGVELCVLVGEIELRVSGVSVEQMATLINCLA